MRTKLAATALAVLIASAAAASAATLSYTGTGQTSVVANNDLGLGLNRQTIDIITGDRASAANGLAVSGPARVTYTYLGFEAANVNYALTAGSQSFSTATSTIGQTITVTQGTGLLSFAFGTSAPAGNVGLLPNDGAASPASVDYAIGYKMLSATSYLVFFDDIAAGDRDFDDIGLRVDVAPVPLPAAGLLLAGGLAGLGALRRRRRA